MQLTVNNVQYKVDLNRGPLVSEATTLVTEPQPLPKLAKIFTCTKHFGRRFGSDVRCLNQLIIDA